MSDRSLDSIKLQLKSRPYKMFDRQKNTSKVTENKTNLLPPANNWTKIHPDVSRQFSCFYNISFILSFKFFVNHFAPTTPKIDIFLYFCLLRLKFKCCWVDSPPPHSLLKTSQKHTYGSDLGYTTTPHPN